MRAGGGIHCVYKPGTYEPVADASNDYLIDRAAQRAKKSFSGVAGIAMQDASLQESMGAIQDRTKERLGTSDSGIIMARQRLLRAAKALAEDGTPPPGLDAGGAARALGVAAAAAKTCRSRTARPTRCSCSRTPRSSRSDERRGSGRGRAGHARRCERFRNRPFPDDGGLLRIEAAGVCGSDVPAYRRIREADDPRPRERRPHRSARAPTARERWGFEAGDRVLIEEYLPCGHCAWCRSDDFRLCDATDIWMGGIRYGSTPVSVAPALWGGFSRYQYLHPRSVLHRVPDDVPAELAALAIPLSNGLQWTQREARVAYGSTVVIQGPGQQGLACVVAAKLAGAARIVVSGLGRRRAPARGRAIARRRRHGRSSTPGGALEQRTFAT